MAFNLQRRLRGGWDEVLTRVKAGLKEQGFGVLTEIDVQATLKEKVGAEMGRYRILGACNPVFADKALALEGRIGVLLPCNVVLRELGEGELEVLTVNPREAMRAVALPELEPLAAEIGGRLEKMLAAL